MRVKKPLIVGHRGAKGLAPENTLESFEVAIQHGVDMIETDVHISKDGQAIVVHDHAFTNIERRRLKVVDASMPQLRKHYQSLVTLAEAIEFIDRRVRLMIEVKERVETKPVIAIVQYYLENGWEPGDFIFASFDFKVLQKLQAALPTINLTVLESWSAVRAQFRARSLDTEYISMDQSYLWWGVVKPLCRRYKLFTYPAQHLPFWRTDPARPKRWAKYGLYGIITDYPDQF